ncbi:DegT/DnrJ/EryC1/StrS family aminotransferase [Desulfospira joergensenii]|uniref:DegT/DnrJ/EryC1/StrS family aminotransferase n=1 Tax=Desulfospira joergensenii TaxID=53329 RepID=UPI0003B47AF0|nr:DegT/DnrJ/EryC1/StrS family aminotransferase [Desulfospira joergensenii]
MISNRIFLSPPHLGEFEQKFVKEAFESNYIAPIGPQVNAFEKEFSKYTGIKHCLALNSGTAAMHLALKEAGVGPGEKVFASSLTFIASVSPAVYLGAELTFIDSDRETWNMDPDLLAEELYSANKQGNLPKAVIPTDLYGQCSDYDRIYEICESYKIPVIIDAAEAMGAYYLRKKNEKIFKLHAGTGAFASIYSFNGNKIITTSGGGMLASDNEDLINRARFLSQQAREPFPYYEHTEIGYNYRMSNVLGALGRGQLKVLKERVQRKKEIYHYYKEKLERTPGIDFMPIAQYGEPNYWLTCILINPEIFGEDRDFVRLSLEKKNIESRPVWKPMHLQPVFQNPGEIHENGAYCKRRYPCKIVGGEVSEDLFYRGLCLPSGTAMLNSDIDRIIEIIHGCGKKVDNDL